jgi:hypothetical protein
MSTPTPSVHPPNDADEVDDNLLTAVTEEVKHEVHNMEYTNEPVDATHSDVLVQKHFSGLFITVLIFVAVVLLIAIGGIALYTHH